MDLIQNFKSILSDGNSGECLFAEVKKLIFLLQRFQTVWGIVTFGVTTASTHAIYQE